MPRFPRLLAAALLTACLMSPARAVAHVVAPGETLSGIAAANGLTTAALAVANGVSDRTLVIAGTTLRVPYPAASVATAAPIATAPSSLGGHLVIVGETLSGIAAANGLSIHAVAAANGLSDQSFVIAGTHLRIPAAGSIPAAAATAAAPPPMGAYTVRPGDSLSALAARSRVAVGQVAAMNGLAPDALLIIGMPLKLPTGSPVLASAPAQPATPVTAQVAPAATPNATPGRLSAGQISAVAAQHGVPGSLAAAIAWQESGFNNAMISSANARGIMQIMPGTWAWVQAHLAPRPLDPSSALDNVHAGSLYLSQLLRDTGGDPALAAAGYYQGLSSVRRVGMFPETRRYVDNVLALRGRFGG